MVNAEMSLLRVDHCYRYFRLMQVMEQPNTFIPHRRLWLLSYGYPNE
jgi:hypothetical protein